jgi:hypothetical protein
MAQIAILLVLLNVMGLVIYGTEQLSDLRQRQLQEPLLTRATDTVGMPTMDNFRERQMLREVFEARDKPIQTQVYLINSDGHLSKLCDSVGYGIPASTQFTNPLQPALTGSAIAQAEPNALFNSPYTHGTWVDCIDHASNQTHLVFVQPNVIISPEPLSGG